jgi:hypothetical protein
MVCRRLEHPLCQEQRAGDHHDTVAYRRCAGPSDGAGPDAEYDEKFRREGEALFPELKPLDFLQGQKRLMSQASWEAEYQPHHRGGWHLPGRKIARLAGVRSVPNRASCAGVGQSRNGRRRWRLYRRRFDVRDEGRDVRDRQREVWRSAHEREQRIRQIAQNDRENLQRPRSLRAAISAATKAAAAKMTVGFRRRDRTWVSYKIVIEQEPGSGGKESAEATLRNLAGFSVVLDRVTGSKEIRAEPFTAHVQAGNVWLVAGRGSKLSSMKLRLGHPAASRTTDRRGGHGVCPPDHRFPV